MKQLLIILLLACCFTAPAQLLYTYKSQHDYGYNECLIKGKRIRYDAMSERSLAEAKKEYSAYEFIGSSHIFFVNGVKVKSKNIVHFFRIYPYVNHIIQVLDTDTTGSHNPQADTVILLDGISYLPENSSYSIGNIVKKDTNNLDFSYGLGSPLQLLDSNYISYRKLSPRFDTVKVLMLLCDTHVCQAFHPHSAVEWRTGYSVREKHNTSEGVMDSGMSPFAWNDYWKDIYYLDENKKRLRNTIYVWMSKEIK
jgi:hypothetical protein